MNAHRHIVREREKANVAMLTKGESKWMFTVLLLQLSFTFENSKSKCYPSVLVDAMECAILHNIHTCVLHVYEAKILKQT